MSTFKFEPGDQVASFSETVWHEFSPLAVKHNAINLGQGFPNWQPPQFVLDAASRALTGDVQPPSVPHLINQYARSGGHPSLCRTLSELYSPAFGRNIDPNTEILITAGASEALYASISSLVNPGDEVILIEPFFDIYYGAVIMARGIPRYLQLKKKNKNGPSTSSDFEFDEGELRALMSPKTKLLILNTPHNPTGKVFSMKELQIIADIVKEHPRCIVISDEVYEWLVYDGAVHNRIANLPGMFERTLTISSAGKTFSVTGWKIGWIIGPAPLVSAVMRAHQFIIFSVATPLQEAIATALKEAQKQNYFEELRQMYINKRDHLFETLQIAGLEPVKPEGSFFIMADVSKIKLAPHLGRENITGLCMDVHDWRVSRWLTTDIGVTCIPASAFYSDEHVTTDMVRFAYCKTSNELELARQRLSHLRDLFTKFD